MMNILRSTTASLLLFFMLFCIVKNTALLSLYELNQDLFVTMLCENKAKPALKCNGKCQLSRIAAEQKQDNAAQVLNSLQTDIFFFHQEAPLNAFSYGIKEITTVYGLLPENHYQSLTIPEDDKPPSIFG